MKVSEVLNRKGWGSVVTDDSVDVATAVRIMTDNHVGAVVVQDQQGGIAGIVTERDIMRNLGERGSALGELDVNHIMSRKPITADPEITVDEALGIMTQNRFRHLPIVRDSHLVGLVSIGDLVKTQLEEKASEAESLREYITHS